MATSSIENSKDHLLKLRNERAIFSVCKKFRYALWREIAHEGKIITFIGLNPSNADAEINDRTINRCISFAKSMNCRGLIMVNLFAFVSTKPSVLKKNSAPIGPDNNAWIVKSAQSSDIVIPAWGNHGNFLNRDNQVMRLLEDYKLFCFGKNKNGSPKHPLYVLGGKAIERFST